MKTIMKTIMGAALELTIAGLVFGPIGIAVLACVYVGWGVMYLAQASVAVTNERDQS